MPAKARVPTKEFLMEMAVISPSGCWEWPGAQTNGYGRVRVGKKMERIHRVSYAVFSCEPIPDGTLVLHKCDNRKCFNPEHLFLGNHKDNRDDCVQKYRHRFGSRHGMSKLSESDVDAIRSDERTQAKIASDYGVTQGLISLVKLGKIWKEQLRNASRGQRFE